MTEFSVRIADSQANCKQRDRMVLGTVLTALLILSCTTVSVAQDTQNNPNEILFGMSTALTGPAADLGLNMKTGVDVAFDEANRNGDVHGMKLRLVALDDGYEPSRTAPNMRTLIDKHQVLAIIGNVGTPTAVVAVPIANASKTLFFGAFTGAGVLRKTPPDRYVINYRASYREETAAMVDALIRDVGLEPEEIGFFTQRDAYGDAGYVGGITALQRHGLSDESLVAHGRYVRNTDAVENALADILGADTPVRAVIMVGAYEPCARFIQLAKEYELDALFINVSFVGAAPLAKALGDDVDGVVVTQVVPGVRSKAPIVEEFHDALHKADADAEPSFGALEGYIAGRIIVKALQDLKERPTRETIVDALENMGDFDIGVGEVLHFDSTDHQACHKVWPTVIRGGQIEELQWSTLRGSKGR